MAETVYILGAGVNRDLLPLFGNCRAPLSKDFFQQALKHSTSEYHIKQLQPLFDYVNLYWHLSVDQLREQPFDLEECFTMIQSQRFEANSRQDLKRESHLIGLEYLLSMYFLEYFQEFRVLFFPDESARSAVSGGDPERVKRLSWPGNRAFRDFAKHLHDTKPAILTFNYDTLLEDAIEEASGFRKVSEATMYRDEVLDEDLPCCHHTWNRLLAYGVKFGEVHLPLAGPSRPVEGDRFYSHPENSLYSPPLLKLHGSMNWLVYTGQTIHPEIPLPGEELHEGKTLIGRPHFRIGGPGPMSANLELLSPIIVTPALYKFPLDSQLISSIWNLAQTELSNARRVRIIGYSFPPTDFHVRKLLREAFASRSPDELVVVNPDTSVIHVAKELCNFNKPVLSCKNLDEYLSRPESTVKAREGNLRRVNQR